ncbi:AAA family ATPase [Thioclava sp. GXIMD2076]|uniref:AAA family ATPase n=1 Tax=Thioclava sp. GXIMD2076 TaxID=3131931 RepID=UPI0030CFC21D
MSAAPILSPEPAPLVACTVSRDVSNFNLLIEDMEAELGESWGDLGFDDTLLFLNQPDAENLEFLAIALDGDDEVHLDRITRIITTAKDKGLRIILIAEELSPIALHQLLRLGADDFVPYPLPEGALHEAIRRLGNEEDEVAPAAPAPARKSSTDRNGAILAVHGMAGGVGASTFAVNLAWELACNPGATGKKKGAIPEAPRVCLIDLDLQYGTVSTYLDLPRREIIFDTLSHSAQLDSDLLHQALQVYQDKLHVFTAPADMLPLDLPTTEDISRLIKTAQSQFDFVVIDMPSTVVQWTETVLSASDLYFAMLELDMRSAQNLLRMIRALQAEELPIEKLRYVLNRAPKFTDLTGKSRVKRLAESLDITIELQLPDGGRAVTQANDHGQPMAEAAAKSPLRREFQKLARTVYDLDHAAKAAQG